jgi:hypothetical protein
MANGGNQRAERPARNSSLGQLDLMRDLKEGQGSAAFAGAFAPL